MYIWEKPMKTMYSYIFKYQNILGNMPYAYREDEWSVTYVTNNGYFYLFLLNCFLYPTFLLKHGVLLLICFSENKYEPGFELLVFWFLGSLFFFTVFVNQVYNRKEIARVISAWLRFENFMKETQPKSEEKAENDRNKLLWLEFLFYCVAGFWVPIFVGVLHTVYPRLPCFLYSVVPKSLDQSPSYWLRYQLIKGLCCLFEVYVAQIGCMIVFGNDLIVSMICKRITASTQRLTRANSRSPNAMETNENINLKRHTTFCTYKSIEVLLGIFQSVYSRLMTATEAITMLLLVSSSFVAMHPMAHPFIRFVLGSVFLFIAAHTLSYFLPMANIGSKSSKFLNSMAYVEGCSKLTRMQMNTCQQVQIKPCGLHRITQTSVLQVFLLAVGYLQFLFQLQIGV